MRKQTLLLCFIHGFKGDDGTFRGFPEHLRVLLQNARPHLNIVTAVYPQYETRGELPSAVSRFREWLQNTVIDLEVASQTPHPTVDPSVHTVLIGHSMGGIVAADTLISITDDIPISSSSSRLPFPHIVGILAFDTPYLGLAPSVFAHSAEGKWKTASAAYTQISSIAGGLFATQAAVDATAQKSREQEERERKQRAQGELAAQQTLWGSWGKIAAYGGAAVALAGGAAAAYIKRDDISAGFGWVQSHLEFVGALMKGDELKSRLDRASGTEGVGFANLFTSLGGDRMGTSMLFNGNERTFCSLPTDGSELRRKWFRCINVAAEDEVGAHCAMFEARTNPAYYDLADRARGLITIWVAEDSYLPVQEEEEDLHMRFRMQGRSTTMFERESKSSKSSRRSSRDVEAESRRASRDQGESGSRRSSVFSGLFGGGSSTPPVLERTDSGKSHRSSKSHSSSGKDRDRERDPEREREKREKRERKERERQGSVYDDREMLERRSSGYGRPELEHRSSSHRSSKDKDREREKTSKRRSSQAPVEENPWR
ncbi:hypothetical protein FPQ18DRAFT_138758 [Pyronema domesticum]|nr:hypothetical protein FPQ18DRAFT_138758 [Pyronema domesticum]